MSGFRLADDDAAKPIVVEDYIDDTGDSNSYAQYTPKRKARRSFSTGDKHGYAPGRDPIETIDGMQVELVEMKKALDHFKKQNIELRKGLERAENLLQTEQKANRDLEKQNTLAHEEVLCLQNDIERLRGCQKRPIILADHANVLEEDKQLEDFGDPFVRHSSWSNLAIPSSEQEKRPRRRKTSAPCGPSTPLLARSPSVSKAKTLCFQISFNGMTLMEKTDFGEA